MAVLHNGGESSHTKWVGGVAFQMRLTHCIVIIIGPNRVGHCAPDAKSFTRQLYWLYEHAERPAPSAASAPVY